MGNETMSEIDRIVAKYLDKHYRLEGPMTVAQCLDAALLEYGQIVREEKERNAIQTLIMAVDAAGGEITISAMRYVTMPDTMTLTQTKTIDGDIVYRTHEA